MRLFPSPNQKRAGAAARGDLTLRQLAHELSSLLDGSMRSLRLADRALLEEEEETPDVKRHLRAAHETLDDIATVLGRALVERTGPARMLEMDRAVGAEVDRVIAALAPTAEELGVELSISVSPASAGLAAGPLGAMLTNGLRNAIEACARVDVGQRRVEASIAVRQDRLLVVIRDTGPGLDAETPGGHGLGLGVCRALVTDLGGSMSLGPAPEGRGALLEIALPAARHAAL